MSNQLAIDPVCGKTIPKQGAITRVRGGKTYYLCSEMCVSRFDTDVGASRFRLEGWDPTVSFGLPGKRPRRQD